MISQDLKKKISNFPENSGVYFFTKKNTKNKEEILYIGKATNLRDRVKSYFSKDLLQTRGPKVLKMIELSDDVRFEKTDSVLEAIVLENFLIKKHQPIYNTKEKDDKSYNFVVITDEKFPRVLLVRGRDISKTDFDSLGFKIKESFGPFTSGTGIKEGLKIIRKIFPFRDRCVPYSSGKIKACFNRQIGLCPGVCTGEITAKDYQKNIKNISRFFQGQKKSILKDLEKQMNSFAKNLKFEEANKIKKQIFAINHIQDISLLKNQKEDYTEKSFRIESYDISHTAGIDVLGVMVVLENGEINKNEYRQFNIQDNPNNNDLKSLEEVLQRRLKHREWTLPDLIVVDGGENQRKIFEKILEESDLKIPVVSVVKNDKHKPREVLGDKQFLKYEREILLSNDEAHRFAITLHRKKREKII
jgi:excinuclease ABC subunit C